MERPSLLWVTDVLKKSFLLTALRAATLFGGVFAVYFLGLKGGFFFDDRANILDVPGLRIEIFSIESLFNAWGSGISGPSGRPFAQLSFALNYYFAGFDPFWFKVTNLTIHFFNGLVLQALVMRWLRMSCPAASLRGMTIASSLCALAWLLHPLQLTSVLYVVQRMTSLSALFLLLALFSHIRAREQGGRWWFFAGWCILWPMSFFSKETGVLFPLFVACWELTIRRSAVQRLDGFARGLAILAGASLTLGFAYLASPSGQWILAGYEQRAFSLVERLLTEGRVFWIYLALIFSPRFESFALNHDDVAISTGIFEPWTTALAWGGVAGLMFGAWWCSRRLPVISFGILWFLLGHSLESTILPLEIAHEHRNYLPLVGPMFAASWLFLLAFEKGGIAKTLGIAIAVALLSYLGFLTAMRSDQFGDPSRRTQFEVLHHPNSPRAQYEAGRLFAESPQTAKADTFIYFTARKHFEAATALDPDFKLGLLGSIFLECRATGTAAQDTLQELARRLRERPFGPGDGTLLLSVKDLMLDGSLCLSRDQVETIFVAMTKNPSATVHLRVLALSWLADYFLLGPKDIPAARHALEESLVLAPWNPDTRLKWVQVSLLEGHFKEAAKMLDEVGNSALSAEERILRDQLMDVLSHAGSKSK